MTDLKRLLQYGPVLMPVVAFLIVGGGFQFNGLYGQDSHEYLRYGRALRHFLVEGIPPGDYHWPVNFPLYGALLSLLLPNTVLAMQLLSVAAFAGVLIYARKLSGLLYAPSRSTVLSIYLIALLALSPYLVRASVVVMSDMLATFFCTATFFHAMKYRSHHKLIDLLALAFLSASAVMTRYGAAVVVLLPAVVALVTVMQKRQWLALLPGLAIAALCMAPHFLIRGEESGAFLLKGPLESWSPGHLLQSAFQSTEGRWHYPLPNLVYAFYNWFHPGFLFAGLPLLVFIRKKGFHPWAAKLLVSSVCLYALFVAGFPIQNLRFLMLTFPLVVVILYPAFERGWQWIATQRTLRALFVTGAVALQVGFCIYLIRPFYHQNLLEKQIAGSLKKYDNRLIYTFAIDMAFRSYGVDNPVENLWTRQIPEFKKGALVLFNEPQFKDQWAGQNPMINWKRLNRQHDLKLLKTYPTGWHLYEIQ